MPRRNVVRASNRHTSSVTVKVAVVNIAMVVASHGASILFAAPQRASGAKCAAIAM
jgi:hypothetical protein